MNNNEIIETTTKDIVKYGHHLVVTAYQNDKFKTGIGPEPNGVIVITFNGNVICSFHAEKSKDIENQENPISMKFTQKPYDRKDFKSIT